MDLTHKQIPFIHQSASDQPPLGKHMEWHDIFQYQADRMKYQRGGLNQEERMIRDKKYSFDRALLYSYQAADVKKVGSEDIVRALINPDKLKQDYDYKIISVDFLHDFHAGDIFEWMGTDTKWLIYLQELTELAYFRGYISRCQYEIPLDDDNSTYASVKGPVETKIDYIQKHGISIDRPNYSLTIMVPRTEETLTYFKRYAKFYMKPIEAGADNICWRVEAIDWISTPGILEIHATEYYANKDNDDKENGIVNGLIPEDVSPNTEKVDGTIVGDVFIRPKKTYTYTYKGNGIYGWQILTKKAPVELTIVDDHTVQVKWTSNYSGQFELNYGSITKTIVVESLF